MEIRLSGLLILGLLFSCCTTSFLLFSVFVVIISNFDVISRRECARTIPFSTFGSLSDEFFVATGDSFLSFAILDDYSHSDVVEFIDEPLELPRCKVENCRGASPEFCKSLAFR